MKNRKSRKGFFVAVLVVLVATAGIAAFGRSTEPPKTDDTTSKITISTPKESIKSNEEKESVNDTEKVEETEPNRTQENKEEEATPSSEEEISSDATAVGNEKVLTFSLPLEGVIIKQFDLEKLQYSATFGDMRLHSGIDIVGTEGTPVKAAANGTVKSIEKSPLWGNVLTLSHSSDTESIYCGLEDIEFKVGDEVRIGKVIGTVGEIPAEISDESHLHFEIKKGGNYISPLEAIGIE